MLPVTAVFTLGLVASERLLRFGATFMATGAARGVPAPSWWWGVLGAGAYLSALGCRLLLVRALLNAGLWRRWRRAAADPDVADPGRAASAVVGGIADALAEGRARGARRRARRARRVRPRGTLHWGVRRAVLWTVLGYGVPLAVSALLLTQLTGAGRVLPALLAAGGVVGAAREIRAARRVAAGEDVA